MRLFLIPTISFNAIREINSIIFAITFDSISLEEIPTTSLHYDDLKPYLEIHWDFVDSPLQLLLNSSIWRLQVNGGCFNIGSPLDFNFWKFASTPY